jgi:uncharacterized membrane protein
MKNFKIATIVATAAIALVSNTAMAEDAAKKDMKMDMTGKEKCYGISKAGKNDCAGGKNSCAGSAKADAQSDAFIVVPTGLCDKLVGGSTEPKADDMKKEG